MANYPENYQPYNGLLAEHYDALFEVSDAEYSFYRYFLEQLNSSTRALEIGCGTGQLLISYAQEGLCVDGIDSSASMLVQCKKKLDDYSLITGARLYHQQMQKLLIHQKYGVIYVPACAFMLVTDYTQACQSLKRFYEHLLPGGKLLLSLFVPHTLTRENSFTLYRDVQLESTRLLLYTFFEYSPLEQIRRGLYKLETYTESLTLEKSYLYNLAWRWYGLQEITQALTLVGFKKIQAYGDYTLEPARDGHESFVVVAEK